MAGMNEENSLSFIQSYTLNQGLSKFGIKGKKAAYKELKQLHDRVVFTPIHENELTLSEKRKAMESTTILTEKRDGTIKARTCANGSIQRKFTTKEGATSPTVATEAVLTTGVIEAKQKRDIMTIDVHNAFVNKPIPKNQ